MNLPNTNYYDLTYLRNIIAAILRSLRSNGLAYSMSDRFKLASVPGFICISGILCFGWLVVLAGAVLLGLVTTLWSDEEVIENIADAIFTPYPTIVSNAIPPKIIQAIASIVLPVLLPPPRRSHT